MLLRLLNSLVKRTKTMKALSEDVVLMRRFLDATSEKPCIVQLSCGAKFFLPDIFVDCIQRAIALTDGFYEVDHLARLESYLSEKSVILDIGANIGNHSLYWGLGHPGRRVVAFEPVQRTFGILKRNIEINGLEGTIQAFNIGLARHEGRARIARSFADNSGGTQIEESDGGEIRIMPLDSCEIPQHVDFIKIDTEGYEIEVLQGAETIIRRERPTIFIEIFDENKKEAQKILRTLGYVESERMGAYNYLYLPSEKQGHARG